MAGTFTHYMICDKAITVIQNREIHLHERSSGSLGRILGKFRHFALLGCGSPDIPYLVDPEWAGKMHYNETNGIVNEGVRTLSSSGGLNQDVERARFVWLMGYLSHIIADTIIHPIIKMIVGPYLGNEHDHRVCEMVQDSIQYRKCMGDDIAYSEYHSLLKQCKNEHYDEVLSFWKILAERAYPKNHYPALSDPDPKLWTTIYLEAMDSIEGGNTIIALFRHIEIAPSQAYAYRPVDELEEKHPEWVQEYYNAVPVPNHHEQKSFDYAFEHAVNMCVQLWSYSFDCIKNGLSYSEVVPCMDLDEGTIIGSSDGRLPLWENVV
jgi:hypothetical protein